MRKLEALGREAAERLREGLRSSEPGDRSAAYRDAARLLVEARRYFVGADGAPDWRGRTYTYRQFVGGVYGDAGVPVGDRSRVSAALRYHVGNALRELLDADELARLGLSEESPLARARVQRAEKADLIRAVTGSASGLESVDALRAIASARVLLERVSTDAVGEWDEAESAAGRELLEGVSARVRALLRKAPKVTRVT